MLTQHGIAAGLQSSCDGIQLRLVRSLLGHSALTAVPVQIIDSVKITKSVIACCAVPDAPGLVTYLRLLH